MRITKTRSEAAITKAILKPAVVGSRDHHGDHNNTDIWPSNSPIKIYQIQRGFAMVQNGAFAQPEACHFLYVSRDQ